MGWPLSRAPGSPIKLPGQDWGALWPLSSCDAVSSISSRPPPHRCRMQASCAQRHFLPLPSVIHLCSRARLARRFMVCNQHINNAYSSAIPPTAPHGLSPIAIRPPAAASHHPSDAELPCGHIQMTSLVGRRPRPESFRGTGTARTRGHWPNNNFRANSLFNSNSTKRLMGIKRQSLGRGFRQKRNTLRFSSSRCAPACLLLRFPRDLHPGSNPAQTPGPCAQAGPPSACPSAGPIP